ncbi:hypothetical protein [Azospirillum griseum]|uniref:Uncharacterized protein n=1 Tax=Azospirillum griseum TaxID=2496639 RepID=A0A3S0K478_9PROT|nr:hypothetical protein [Azospirillum griseum]RTR19832.1 hypothetical protein EJ903_12590 [Azospirillum griseum]
MVTTHRLFADAWLAPLSPDLPADAAASVIAAALAQMHDAQERFRHRLQDVELSGDPTHIRPLLQAETALLPEAASSADNAVHGVMERVAFKRRALLPLFPPLLERLRLAHADAVVECARARWRLMARRAATDPGAPSSPIQGLGTRYVKSDRFDARAMEQLPPDDRVRADRALKRLGDYPIPVELDIRPLSGGGLDSVGLWTIKAGGTNRFILRRDQDRRGPHFVVEDVGPWREEAGH